MRLIFKISIFFLGGLVCFFTIFTFVNFNSQNEMEEGGKLSLSEQEIINNCNNRSLVNTSICLRDNIETFFIYNRTDDKLTLNFDDLKERGGDCRNWAFLYQRLGRELNFNASTVRNDKLKGVFNAHRYAVLWDNNSYCKLDMLKEIKCYEIDSHTN